MFLGYSAVNTYTLYILQDYIHLHKAVAVSDVPLLAVATFVGFLIAVFIAGWWSDRIGRRKPFVRHINVFVNGEQGGESDVGARRGPRRGGTGDNRRVRVDRAGRGDEEGPVPARGRARRGFEIKARAFAGEPVDFATRDPRSGRLLATVTSPFYGPKIFYTDGDPAGEWQQADGVALPEGGDQALERIWVIACGEDDGTLYAGGDPGVLFESHDGGTSWELNAGLWEQPSRPTGSPAAVGCACTRSAPGRAIRTAWPSRSRQPGCG